jgi:predicted acylesterase/phospholipase RssA
MEKITHLVIGGGGFRGMSIVGALASIDNVVNITHISATSIGSVIAILYLAGYTPSDIKEIASNNCFLSTDNWDIDSLFTNFGIDDFSVVSNLLESLIAAKLGNVYTFLDFYNSTGKSLTVNGYNISLSKITYFDHISTPHCPLITAVSISCRIPLYYTKLIYDNHLWADGCITDSFPQSPFSSVPSNSLLGLCVEKSTREIDNIFQYVFNIISCVFSPCHDARFKIMYLPALHYNIVELDYTKSDIENLFNVGFECAELYLKKQN